MTDTFHYPPAAPARRPPRGGAPGPVLLSVAGPAAQRRVTVAVRLILAVPHLVTLYVLGLAASVVVVIGWFGALAIGQLPDFAVTYLTGYLRWNSRVNAYLLLLTDQYPPFTIDDAAYPVRLAVGSGRLNRLSVLFRLILAIPAAIVSTLLTSGFATIVLFIGWLAALVTGRLPASFHQAYTAVLRYSVRFYGYAYLLTGTYPGELFGDPPGQPAQAAQAAPPAAGGYPVGFPGQAGPPPGYGAPWEPAAGYGRPDYGTPGYGSPTYGAPGYQPAAAARSLDGPDPSWRLVLSPGARRLVGLLLVLGLLTAAGEGAWIGVGINAARLRAAEISQLNTAVARFIPVVERHNAAAASAYEASQQVGSASDALLRAHDALSAVLSSSSTDSTNCSTVSCFNLTSLPIANALGAFGRSLHAIVMPPASAAAARKLSADTAATERDWRASAQDADFTSLENDDNAAEKDGGRFDNDYTTLQDSLSQQGLDLGPAATKLNSESRTLNSEGATLRHRAAALNVTVTVPVAQGAS